MFRRSPQAESGAPVAAEPKVRFRSAGVAWVGRSWPDADRRVLGIDPGEADLGVGHHFGGYRPAADIPHRRVCSKSGWIQQYVYRRSGVLRQLAVRLVLGE